MTQHATHTIQDTTLDAFAKVEDSAFQALILRTVNTFFTKTGSWPTTRELMHALDPAMTPASMSNAQVAISTLVNKHKKLTYIGKRKQGNDLGSESYFFIVAPPGTPKDASYVAPKPGFCPPEKMAKTLDNWFEGWRRKRANKNAPVTDFYVLVHEKLQAVLSTKG